MLATVAPKVQSMYMYMYIACSVCLMTTRTESTVNASQLATEKKRFSLCCFEREFVAPGSAGAQRFR